MRSNDLVRRCTLALTLAAVTLSAACSSTGEQAAEPALAQTRNVSTPYGDQLVPTDPQRVLTLESRRDFETMVALGLTPVAAGHQGDRDTPFADFIDADVSEVELAFPANNEDLETIARIDPDLVVGRGVAELEIFDALQAIAPVLSVEGGGDWKVDLRAIAEAVGREDRAEELIAEYEQRVAEVREQYADELASSKVGVLQYGGEEAEFYWSAPLGFYLQSQVLTELGGTFPDFLAAAGNEDFDASETASTEQLPELADADALLVIANVLEDAGVDDRAALAADPLWNRLPAVQADRVVLVTSPRVV